MHGCTAYMVGIFFDQGFNKAKHFFYSYSLSYVAKALPSIKLHARTQCEQMESFH